MDTNPHPEADRGLDAETQEALEIADAAKSSKLKRKRKKREKARKTKESQVENRKLKMKVLSIKTQDESTPEPNRQRISI
jgi:Tfp pilus assembly protein FimV